MPPLELSDLPDTVLEEILSFLPAKDLLRTYCLVNKRWKQQIDSQSLWRKKCEKIKIYSSKHFPKPPKDFKRYFFQNPYTRNLIKNPSAEEKFKYWSIDEDGGDEFKVEGMIGCDSIGKYTGDQGVQKCWVTSYEMCEKHQIIDLLEAGCSEEILDDIQPEIYVSEWYAARFDCGIHYKLNITLLNEEKETLDSFSFSDEKPANRQWYQIEHTFTSYPKGVRFIKFQHAGMDSKWWAGHYGAKFTLSTVKFNFLNTD